MNDYRLWLCITATALITGFSGCQGTETPAQPDERGAVAPNTPAQERTPSDIITALRAIALVEIMPDGEPPS